MISKPFAAFGNVVFFCSEKAGVVHRTTLDQNGKYELGKYYFISGDATLTDLDGNTIGQRSAGWLSSEHSDYPSVSGEIKCTYSQPTEWVCIPKLTNNGTTPEVMSIHLTPGEYELTNNSDILLCKGTIEANGKTFTGPAQIRVRSGDIHINVTEEVYALRFLE